MSRQTESSHASALHEESPADAAGSAAGFLTTAAVELAALAATLGWVAFWLNVARLHVTADGSMVGHDLTNAAFTVVLTVLPAVGVYAWHLAGPFELPSVGALFDRRSTGESADAADA